MGDVDAAGVRVGRSRVGSASVAEEDHLDLNYAVQPDTNGTRLWCPPAQSKHGTDPYVPRKDDGPGVADWRKRMPSEAGKVMYRERTKAECLNADARRMGLRQLTVRGKDKARTVLLWFALAHNMLRALALQRNLVAGTA